VKIDLAVRGLVQRSYDRARRIIEEYKEPMIRVSEALLERESLDGEEVKRLLAGETLAPFSSSSSGPKSGGESQQIVRTEPDAKPSNPGLMEGGSPAPA